jgi:dihydroflavonol-4-reductase
VLATYENVRTTEPALSMQSTRYVVADLGVAVAATRPRARQTGSSMLDLVDGIILYGEHPAAVGQTYILSGPRYTTITELVAAVAKAVGQDPPRGSIPMWPVMLAARACEALCRPLRIEPSLHKRRLDFFLKDRGFSSAKAVREIGFAPRVSLEDGLARTAA